MPTNSLGKTGFKVGILSLADRLPLKLQEGKRSLKKLFTRIDLGVNYIDTAASYGRGVSQLNIGRVMKNKA